MVDALRRARDWLSPDGRLINLHPTLEPAHVEVVTPSRVVRVGDVVDGSDANGPGGRHHAADLALIEAVVTRRWFTLASRSAFSFASEGDSIDAIEEHLRTKWRAASLDAQTREHARALLGAHPGASVRVIEQVAFSCLLPR